MHAVASDGSPSTAFGEEFISPAVASKTFVRVVQRPAVASSANRTSRWIAFAARRVRISSEHTLRPCLYLLGAIAAGHAANAVPMMKRVDGRECLACSQGRNFE